jgi:hypothetical protein
MATGKANDGSVEGATDTVTPRRGRTSVQDILTNAKGDKKPAVKAPRPRLVEANLHNNVTRCGWLARKSWEGDGMLRGQTAGDARRDIAL